MDERTKELIAIGASAAVNCHPCIDLHLSACDRLGISRYEASAAVEVGLAVNRGAAAKTRSKVTALFGTVEEPEGGSSGGSCC